MNRIVVAPMIAVILFSAGVSGASDENVQKGVKQLIFDERRIEGKIRRPQLVLIKAEQRPDFDPMVLQSLGKAGNIAEAVEKTMLERSPYDNAFLFRDKRIVGYVP